MSKYFSIFFLAVCFVFAINIIPANAADLSGWAWSSNIGWISFNSANSEAGSGAAYVVTIDPFGNFGGYAWSSNIGWISFEDGDLAGCVGTTQAHVSTSTGAVTGWARAVVGKCRTDGWDGCIQLSDNQYFPTSVSNGSGGATFIPASGQFVGYAWGGIVLGWISFNPALSGGSSDTPPVVCTNCGEITGGPSLACSISVNPSSLPSSGGNIFVSWLSSNAQSCSVTANPGTKISDALNDSKNLSITQTTSYSISCQNTTLTPSYCSSSQTATVGYTGNTLKLWVGSRSATTDTYYKVNQGQKAPVFWNTNIGSGGVCAGYVLNAPGAVTTLSGWTGTPQSVSNAINPLNLTMPTATGIYTLGIQCQTAPDENGVITKIPTNVTDATYGGQPIQNKIRVQVVDSHEEEL